jgi:predicted nucleic acid-binding protein
MSAPLDAVPDGSDILVDANIFIYGITNQSPQCKTFLARCSNEQVFGITLFEVVNDACRSEGKAVIRCS